MQRLIAYVPEVAWDNPDEAIILRVGNSGWFAGPVREQVEEGGACSATSDDDPVGRALADAP